MATVQNDSFQWMNSAGKRILTQQSFFRPMPCLRKESGVNMSRWGRSHRIWQVFSKHSDHSGYWWVAPKFLVSTFQLVGIFTPSSKTGWIGSSVKWVLPDAPEHCRRPRPTKVMTSSREMRDGPSPGFGALGTRSIQGKDGDSASKLKNSRTKARMVVVALMP